MELNGLGCGCLVVLAIAVFVGVGLFYEPEGSTASSPTEITAVKGKAIGKFKEIRLEHGVSQNGVKGMNAIVDFEVKNLQGCEGLYSFYFVYDNGADVKGIILPLFQTSA